MEDLKTIAVEALKEIEDISDLEGLEKIRIQYLGKNGVVTQQMKQIGSLTPSERKLFGANVNDVKVSIVHHLETRKQALESVALEAKLIEEAVDVSLPTRHETKGQIHPISQAIEEAVAILSGMGFDVEEGPDIEDDHHNFTALNIPENHPARQMHDTFYFPQEGDESPAVLRTHTSPVQIRTMEQGKPPFRIIAPGRTYRCDSDITHTPMFHQIEGLWIDKEVHMGHLKGCITEFIRTFFEDDDVPVRFRPSFFPFTEPSAEVDIGCSRSKGELIVGKGNDWLEVLGCGMVHPNVLRNVGLDPEEYQGFAFGLGVERLAMLKYGIPDLRTFFDSDTRWLDHYGFSAFDIPTLIGGLTQ